jgi:hypothetical protein
LRNCPTDYLARRAGLSAFMGIALQKTALLKRRRSDFTNSGPDKADAGLSS